MNSNRRRKLSIVTVLLSVSFCSAERLKTQDISLSEGLSNRIELVQFGGGEFLMGCPDKLPPGLTALSASKPQHKVFLSAFAIGKYPVTVDQFCEFLNSPTRAGTNILPRVLPPHVRKLPHGAFEPIDGKERMPVRRVDYKTALQFCLWLSQLTQSNCRLPSEAEWEFVAKGGSQNRNFPWGEQLRKTNPWGELVGAYVEYATKEGVFDMNGPVYQWCLDIFSEDFYTVSPYRNPVCMSGGKSRVVRGGPMFRGRGERMKMPTTWQRFQLDEVGSETVGFRIVVQLK